MSRTSANVGDGRDANEGLRFFRSSRRASKTTTHSTWHCCFRFSVPARFPSIAVRPNNSQLPRSRRIIEPATEYSKFGPATVTRKVRSDTGQFFLCPALHEQLGGRPGRRQRAPISQFDLEDVPFGPEWLWQWSHRAPFSGPVPRVMFPFRSRHSERSRYDAAAVGVRWNDQFHGLRLHG